VNPHLARVRATLDARSAERDALSASGDPCEPSTPALSWSAFSFINEFNAGKSRETDESRVNEDGSGGLVWRHELPSDVFACASVDAARALENFSSLRRGERSGAPVGLPRFLATSKVTLRAPCCCAPADPVGICTATHARSADRHPHNHRDNVMRALGRNRVPRRTIVWEIGRGASTAQPRGAVGQGIPAGPNRTHAVRQCRGSTSRVFEFQELRVERRHWRDLVVRTRHPNHRE
jgi:hypothetical protein